MVFRDASLDVRWVLLPGGLTADTSYDGCVLDYGNDFGRHLDNNIIGIAIRHEAGKGTSTCHPKASAIVDDYHVAASGLDEDVCEFRVLV